MNRPPGNLIDWLRLLEGRMSVSEAAAARRQLRDPQLRARWQLLERVAADRSLAEPGRPAAWELPEETLAAFVEGELSPAEAADVERQCWASPELLRELVSAYRFLHGHRRRAAVRPAATRRLLDLLQGVEAKEAGALWRAIDEQMAAPPASGDPNDGGDPPQVALSGLRPNGAPLADRLRRGRPRPVWLWHAAAALAGVALALGTVALVSVVRHSVPGPAPELASSRDLERPADVRQRGAPPPSPSPEQPQPIAEPLKQFDPDQQQPPRPQPAEVVEAPVGPPQAVEQPPMVESPGSGRSDEVPQAPPSRYATFAVQWGRIEGLVVARGDDQAAWRGALALSSMEAAPRLATLPDSWAEARIEQGRMVLGPDTSVHLDGSGEVLQVAVDRGGVAFDELASGSELQLHSGTSSCVARAARDGTAIGFLVAGSRSLIVVRRGELLVAGTRVGARRQVELQQDGLGTPSTLKTSTAWIDRPQQTLPLPSALQAELLNSPDVAPALVALRETADAAARLVSARWSLAMFPQETFAETLTAADRQLRQETFRWLLACEAGDPRLRQAWRALAATTGDAQAARAVAHWAQLARQGQRPDRDEALAMVQALNHDHLAVRQLSAFFLELALGQRVDYDPDAPPAARQQAVRQWMLLLRRLSVSASPRNAAASPRN